MAKRPKREEIEKKIKEIETELLDLSKRQQDTSKEFNQGIQYAIGYAVGSIERIFKPILEPEEKNGKIKRGTHTKITNEPNKEEHNQSGRRLNFSSREGTLD